MAVDQKALGWNERLREFVKDVRVEITKVSWPTMAELRASTAVVIATVFLVGVFVGIVDRLLNVAVAFVFR